MKKYRYTGRSRGQLHEVQPLRGDGEAVIERIVIEAVGYVVVSTVQHRVANGVRLEFGTKDNECRAKFELPRMWQFSLELAVAPIAARDYWNDRVQTAQEIAEFAREARVHGECPASYFLTDIRSDALRDPGYDFDSANFDNFQVAYERDIRILHETEEIFAWAVRRLLDVGAVTGEEIREYLWWQ